MGDIVERLRSEASVPKHRGTPLGFAAMDAANELERLKISRDRWREMALAYRLGTLEGDNLYEEMMGRG